MTEPGVFFIATAHAEYRQREFPEGSVVIDPWRMIPDQKGVTVKRLGENKPPLISVLVPSRGRPIGLANAIVSAHKMATHPRRVEYVVRLDEDDPAHEGYFSPPIKEVNYLTAERTLLSSCWNECADAAKGEILMHCGDDVTFNTPGWDQMVRDAFAAVPDRLALVYGDDLSPNFPALATHGFVHRRWVETVGYFLPPLFSCDWNDVWLTELAQEIGRAIPIPQMVIEHHHYSFGKAPKDRTHMEREARGEADDVVGIYERTADDRARDIEKLRAVMV